MNFRPYSARQYDFGLKGDLGNKSLCMEREGIVLIFQKKNWPI